MYPIEYTRGPIYRLTLPSKDQIKSYLSSDPKTRNTRKDFLQKVATGLENQAIRSDKLSERIYRTLEDLEAKTTERIKTTLLFTLVIQKNAEKTKIPPILTEHSSKRVTFCGSCD